MTDKTETEQLPSGSLEMATSRPAGASSRMSSDVVVRGQYQQRISPGSQAAKSWT